MSKIDQSIFEVIKDIVAERMELDIESNKINSETKLMEDGLGLDSISMLDIVAALEDRFDILIEDDDLNFDIFKNVGSLTKFTSSMIERKTNN